MYSISELAKLFNLSRGTLLYYDSIGLLRPTERTKANYRRYSENDAERLEEICRYRETGMPLEDIKELLDAREKTADRLLEKRLDELNREIRKLNIQRQIIVYMLKCSGHQQTQPMDTFMRVLENAGFSDDELTKLHAEFVKTSPEEHQVFLEFLGISPDEIRKIRDHSRKAMGKEMIVKIT